MSRVDFQQMQDEIEELKRQNSALMAEIEEQPGRRDLEAENRRELEGLRKTNEQLTTTLESQLKRHYGDKTPEKKRETSDGIRFLP